MVYTTFDNNAGHDADPGDPGARSQRFGEKGIPSFEFALDSIIQCIWAGVKQWPFWMDPRRFGREVKTARARAPEMACQGIPWSGGLNSCRIRPSSSRRIDHVPGRLGGRGSTPRRGDSAWAGFGRGGAHGSFRRGKKCGQPLRGSGACPTHCINGRTSPQGGQ
jgi:hypothetical protein